MTLTIIVLVVLAVVLWGFYVSWRASRLDRLHNRAEAARTALDLAPVRRASAGHELASSRFLRPARPGGAPAAGRRGPPRQAGRACRARPGRVRPDPPAARHPWRPRFP